MDADPREGMSMEKKEAIWILENGAWWDRKKKEAAREGCFLFAWVVTFHWIPGILSFYIDSGDKHCALACERFPKPENGRT